MNVHTDACSVRGDVATVHALLSFVDASKINVCTVVRSAHADNINALTDLSLARAALLSAHALPCSLQTECSNARGFLSSARAFLGSAHAVLVSACTEE